LVVLVVVVAQQLLQQRSALHQQQGTGAGSDYSVLHRSWIAVVAFLTRFDAWG
jgi:hypothetical protein